MKGTLRMDACPQRRFCDKIEFIPERGRPPAQSTDPAARRRDVIYAVLGDPLRRRLLEMMADGTPRHANGCARHLGKRISATINHSDNLREAGLVDASTDPDDSRRQLYTLSPQVQLRRDPAGEVEMDFGCCVLRLPAPPVASATLDCGSLLPLSGVQPAGRRVRTE